MKTYHSFAYATILVMGLCTTAVSCGDDDESEPSISITPASVSLHYDEKQQLTASTDVEKWETENDFIAAVDQSGLVTARHIGTTRIYARKGGSEGTAAITVTPQYNLYDAPITNFGASLQAIKKAETHELSTENENNLMYTYSSGNHPCIVAYGFENGGLKRISVMLKQADFAEAGLHLLERFQPVYGENNQYLFLNAMTTEAATMAVLLMPYTSGGTTVTSIGYVTYPLDSEVKASFEGASFFDEMIP